MIYKTNESIIIIQAEAIQPISTGVVFWSYDRGTAKLRFKLQKNGLPQSLPEGTMVPIRLIFKSATAEGGYGKHDYLATIEDRLNGIVSIVLEDNILGYQGRVDGSIYIDFPNDQSLDTAGRFTFDIKRSPIDDSTPELEDYYFNGFSQIIDKIEKILADGKQEIEQKITESETQIDAKVKDTNDKITKANQDVATLNTNIDKANDRIDQTNQQIGDLGKLKKMYSNSIDFGDYDYSGNPNLLPILDFSKLSKTNNNIQSPPPYVKDHGTYFEVDMGDPSASGVSRNVFIPLITRLQKGKTYTISANIMISDGMITGKCPLYYSVYRSLPKPDTLRPVALYPTNDNNDNFVRISKTFTIPSDLTDGDFAPFLQWYFPSDAVGKYYVGYDIKIEEGTTSTPYQPNLLDDPYWLGKTPLGENIADPTKTFPIKSKEYQLYEGRLKGDEKWEADQRYVIWLKGTKPSSQTFTIYLNDTGAEAVTPGSLAPVEGLADVWAIYFTVTQEYVDKGITNNLLLFQSPYTSVGDVNIESLKIEKGDTRTPNISEYKYFGEGLKDSNNPNDYSWDITAEYTEKGLNNTVSLTEPQSVEGLKNFEDGLQLKGVSVVQDNFTSKAVTTKNITDFTEDSIVRFERWGRLVIANIEITNKSANFAGWKNLMAFPSGYTPISLVGWGGTLSNKTNRNPALSVYANASGISVMISSADLPANQRCSGTVAYFTNDEWPQD